MFATLKSVAGKTGLVALSLLTGAAAFADDPAAVTLPDTGVDVAGYATAAITSLGAIVAVVIGGTVAFILIRAGVRWIRGMK